MGSSTARKSSIEHEYFIVVTFLNKIGEERIWDLTGDVLFPVTFKCAMLIVIREDLRPYWRIISNNVFMCIENRENLPRLWTEVLTPQVVANWMNWSFHVYLDGPGKDTGTRTNHMAMICKKEKTQGLKHESRSTDAGLKSWTLDASLIHESRVQNFKTQSLSRSAKKKMNLNAQPNIIFTSKDWNVRHILKAQTRVLKKKI